MKTEKNILIAFILNLSFSVFELFGGIFTHSVAILSDSLHDFGDAVSIGLSYFFERKSKKSADISHNYGYRRYSVLGGLITTVILMAGSVFMIIEAVKRIVNPVDINYRGMIYLAIAGVVLNLIASYVTKDGHSINQKSVNLHMLEDVLGWVVVLAGAVVMNFTKIKIIDPVMSIGVAVFIFVFALKNLFKISDIFLEKTPCDIDINELSEHLLGIDGIMNIHHFHIRSIDGYNHYATMHIVTDTDDEAKLKEKIRNELSEHHIVHAVIETEKIHCGDDECRPNFSDGEEHHHHHH